MSYDINTMREALKMEKKMKKKVRETVVKLSNNVEYSWTWFGLFKAKRKTIDVSENNDRKINK